MAGADDLVGFDGFVAGSSLPARPDVLNRNDTRSGQVNGNALSVEADRDEREPIPQLRAATPTRTSRTGTGGLELAPQREGRGSACELELPVGVGGHSLA